MLDRDSVDRGLLDRAVRTHDDRTHASPIVLDRDATFVEVDCDSHLFDLLLKRLPHLTRAQSWVPELLDQCSRHIPSQTQHAQCGMPEREVFDPLRRPLRTNL